MALTQRLVTIYRLAKENIALHVTATSKCSKTIEHLDMHSVQLTPETQQATS